MSDYNLFSQNMAEFCRSGTRFIIFIPRPVTTSYNRFFCGFLRSWSAVLGFWSFLGLVCGPSKKGNRTETGPDFKALIIHAQAIHVFLPTLFTYSSHYSCHPYPYYLLSLYEFMHRLFMYSSPSSISILPAVIIHAQAFSLPHYSFIRVLLLNHLSISFWALMTIFFCSDIQ